ncbi:MAG: hypothetical protein SFY80_00830 [Verrucomicrobiota bacterium]|nr:hypothetical protein [Verrucomicrobiota bacterium]
MESEKQAVELVDFLYRDKSRLASYYAQIFGGRLMESEITSGVNNSKTLQGSLSVAVASGNVTNEKAISEEKKDTLDPHDAANLDVFIKLLELKKLWQGLRHAKPGDLVKLRGSLFLLDRVIIDACLKGMEMTPNQIPGGRKEMKIMKEMLSAMPFPTAYFLKLEDGTIVNGTIKDSGLEEPVSAYYFRYGGNWVGNVILYGILDNITAAKDVLDIVNVPFLSASQTIAQGMRSLLFPPDGKSVTPITICRVM